MYRKFLAILLILFSCSDEEITPLNYNSSEIKLNKETIINQKTRIVEAAISPYENRLHWVSFLIAETLLLHESSRERFAEVLNNSSIPNVIRLNELLSSNNENQLFRDAFKIEFDFYSLEPEYSKCGRPNDRPRPPGETPTSAPQTESLFNLYIMSLLNDDCLELYLPNGLISNITTTGYTDTIISSAHPLNNSQNNESYVSRDRCDVVKGIINDRTEGLIIIARPYRNLNTRNCSYEGYSGIDFTSFLN